MLILSVLVFFIITFPMEKNNIFIHIYGKETCIQLIINEAIVPMDCNTQYYMYISRCEIENTSL